jgi:hypothetical protein
MWNKITLNFKVEDPLRLNGIICITGEARNWGG